MTAAPQTNSNSDKHVQNPPPTATTSKTRTFGQVATVLSSVTKCKITGLKILRSPCSLCRVLWLSSDHGDQGITQVGKDLRRSPVSPPAQSRVSSEVSPGYTEVYPLGF